MQEEWYYTVDGCEIGPVSPKELKRLASTNIIERTTPVRPSSREQSVPAGRVRGLFAVVTPEESGWQPGEAQSNSVSEAQDKEDKFGYKGDFIGDSLLAFLQRSEEEGRAWTLTEASEIRNGSIEQYGLDEWITKTDRVQAYVATGRRMTIVGKELEYGSYEFFDGALFCIHLRLVENDVSTWTHLQFELEKAYGDPEDSKTVASMMHIHTWQRKKGRLVLNYFYASEDGDLTVRYLPNVDDATFEAYQKLEHAMTVSTDL